MPPKQQPSKKAEQKKKEKIIEDKTFGMKNKKGAQNQKYVQQIQNQIRNNNTRLDLIKAAEAKKKKEMDELRDVTKLIKPVEQKVQRGPSAVIPFILLRLLVTLRPTIRFDNCSNFQVCKYFLQAVEESKYGWFWECPNGGEKCQYRHCLPEGYVLKKDRKKMEEQDKENRISLEELIEKEVKRSPLYSLRAALSSKNLTKVTLQSFVAWKKRKLREKKQKEADEEKAKKDKIKAGKALGMSGRDLFTFNADACVDDEDAEDVEFEKEEVDPDERVFEIDNSFFKFGGMDDDLDNDGAAPVEGVAGADGLAAGVGSIAINEELFDVDEGLEGLTSDEDEPAASQLVS
ncbi:hypothetical protein COOONC_11355 [Cooperia oncophora]